MKLTRKDREERKARLADGTSPDPDDDRRLVKLYESRSQPVDEPVEKEKPQAAARRSRDTRSL